MNLAWHASASPVMGYNVYRSLSPSGPFTKINAVLEPATVYMDETVLSGKTYYYVVTAVDSKAESVHSNEITARIPSP